MSGHSEKLKVVRHELPVTAKIIYMNTGGVGPLPGRTALAMEAAVKDELNQGRIGPEISNKKKALKTGTRATVADLINAAPEELVLTQNTTEGINMVISGFQWSHNDEVITSDVEHAAVLLPLYLIRDRYGVQIKFARSDENMVKAVAEQITPKTRLIAVSHVSFSTGVVLPVGELAEVAHRHSIPLLVDGAQAAGAMPVDVKALKVDYYSLPGQKWLCGPQGTGALYVSREQLENLKPTFIGLASTESMDNQGSFELHPAARRFEISSVFYPALAGQQASIRWLSEEVGFDWIYKRIGYLSGLVKKELSAIKGIKVLTPEPAAGLVTFTMPDLAPVSVVALLARQGIVVRPIAELDSVRASLGFFNTEEEVGRFIKAVAEAKSLAAGKEIDHD